MRKKLIRKIEAFELHHKILVFIATIFLTIAITRLIVFFKNYNLTLGGFEFHHFDYGLVLLIISVLLLLFGEKKKPIYSFLSAIAIGLILDDFWFIRNIINDPTTNEVLIYNSALPSVILGVIILILVIFLIKHFANRKK